MPVSRLRLLRLATNPITTQRMARDLAHIQCNNMSQSAYLSFDLVVLGVPLPTCRRSDRWNRFAALIASTQQSVKFWGATFAQSSHSTSGFSPQAIFEEGIDSTFPGSLISTYVCFLTQTRCAFMLIDSLVV